MSMDAFMEAVKQGFKAEYGDRYSIKISNIAGNNGTRTAAADIFGPNGGIPIRVLIDDIYRSYSGGTGIHEICRGLALLYDKHEDDICRNEALLSDYGKAKGRVFCSLMNARMNAGILSDSLYIPFHDLAIVFYVIPDGMCGIIPVSRRIFDSWGVDIKTLEVRALSNTQKRFGCLVRPMDSMLMEMVPQAYGEEGKDWLEGFMECLSDEPQMYSVTNEQLYNGSVSILYPGLLDTFAKRTGSSFYILPSSINDVIFVPSKNTDDASEWKQRVRCVNTLMPKELILSDNVYYYSRENGRLRTM